MPGTPNWVVFDYGEVISRRTRAVPDLAVALDTDPDVFAEAYWAERAAYDRGCGDEAYFAAVGRRLGIEVDGPTARRLAEVDAHGWLTTEPDVLTLISELSRAGIALAMLSNAPSTFGSACRREPWAAAFTHMLFSGDLEVVKPDPAIYAELLRTLDATAGECLFFDDREDNVRVAQEFGMRAELWAGPAAARRVLADNGLLPAPA